MNFPSADQADNDLLNSLGHLQSLLPATDTGMLEHLLEALPERGNDRLIAPIVYAWYREFTLENLSETESAGLVKVGTHRLGAGWPTWANSTLTRGEIEIVTPHHGASPYTAEGWSLLLNEGSSGLLKVEAPSDEQLLNFQVKVGDALELFNTVAPMQYTAWRNAMRMIVAVVERRDSDISLAGGSSLFLPGVMVVNVTYCTDTLETLATLVHEAAHVQLNSLCSHEPLCFNAADKVFNSPLRRDARPMEGVIHANYVCAVLAELFLRISQSPNHTEPPEQALKIAQDHYRPLALQVAQIREYAKLSTAGKDVLGWLQAVVETCGELTID